MFACLVDPGGCIAAGWSNLLAAVPWWAWVALALVAIGLAWRLAGWPGVVALAFVGGYFARDLMRAWRVVRAPHEPVEHVDGPDAEPAPKRQPKKRKTLEDLFREGLR